MIHDYLIQVYIFFQSRFSFFEEEKSKASVVDIFSEEGLYSDPRIFRAITYIEIFVILPIIFSISLIIIYGYRLKKKRESFN